MQCRVAVVLLAAVALAACRDMAGEVGVEDAAVSQVDAEPPLPPPVGAVGPGGGSVDRLVFAVFGDVRPGNIDEDSLYPRYIIGNIFKQIAGSYAEFAVGTGDYMFASTSAHAQAQITDLLVAESVFDRPVFHVLGNHECEGWTTSNCPNGTETAMMRTYMTQLVPFATKPYFSFTVATLQGDAKFVFVAANAWSDAQDAWLRDVLAVPSRYTFVIRHEPSSDNRAPGVDPSDAILAGAQTTLTLFGHSHLYERIGDNAVISGNSGAPVSHGYYGWLLVQQRLDGNIEVQSIEQNAGRVVTSWVVDPTGARVP